MEKALTPAAAANVRISVVIPCYNSGAFLPETLHSVTSDPEFAACEIIVVDDGSTDAATLALLGRLPGPRCRLIRQANQGPAAARNAGIRAAQAPCILLLDSDNKLRPGYLSKGLAVLHQHPEVGVVYAKASFFGDSTRPRFRPHPFDGYKMLQENFIDICTVIRKQMWEEIGGLDEARVLIGHEDWEFWIRAAGAGWKFWFLDEILFEYRIRHDSLVMAAKQEGSYRQMLAHVHARHWQQYVQAYNHVYWEYEHFTRLKARPTRTLLGNLYRLFVPLKPPQ